MTIPPKKENGSFAKQPRGFIKEKPTCTKIMPTEARYNISEKLIGKIYMASWDYDPKNIAFFVVLSRKGCYAILQELKQQEISEAGFMCVYVSACPGQFREGSKPLRRKIRVSNDSIYFRIDTFKAAYRWDGKKHFARFSSEQQTKLLETFGGAEQTP